MQRKYNCLWGALAVSLCLNAVLLVMLWAWIGGIIR